MHITIIFMLLFSGSLVAQDTLLVEVKDYREQTGYFRNDTLRILKDRLITPVYIERVFRFVVPTKEWLTKPQDAKKRKESVRPTSYENAYRDKAYDSLGRLTRDTYFSCFSCIEESFEKLYLYDTTGNIVTIVKMSDEDVALKKKGIANTNESSDKRNITVIHYSPDGTINAIKASKGDDTIFSLRRLN